MKTLSSLYNYLPKIIPGSILSSSGITYSNTQKNLLERIINHKAYRNPSIKLEKHSEKKIKEAEKLIFYRDIFGYDYVRFIESGNSFTTGTFQINLLSESIRLELRRLCRLAKHRNGKYLKLALNTGYSFQLPENVLAICLPDENYFLPNDSSCPATVKVLEVKSCGQPIFLPLYVDVDLFLSADNNVPANKCNISFSIYIYREQSVTSTGNNFLAGANLSELEIQNITKQKDNDMEGTTVTLTLSPGPLQLTLQSQPKDPFCLLFTLSDNLRSYNPGLFFAPGKENDIGSYENEEARVKEFEAVLEAYYIPLMLHFESEEDKSDSLLQERKILNLFYKENIPSIELLNEETKKANAEKPFQLSVRGFVNHVCTPDEIRFLKVSGDTGNELQLTPVNIYAFEELSCLFKGLTYPLYCKQVEIETKAWSMYTRWIKSGLVDSLARLLTVCPEKTNRVKFALYCFLVYLSYVDLSKCSVHFYGIFSEQYLELLQKFLKNMDTAKLELFSKCGQDIAKQNFNYDPVYENEILNAFNIKRQPQELCLLIILAGVPRSLMEKTLDTGSQSQQFSRKRKHCSTCMGQNG